MENFRLPPVPGIKRKTGEILSNTKTVEFLYVYTYTYTYIYLYIFIYIQIVSRFRVMISYDELTLRF